MIFNIISCFFILFSNIGIDPTHWTSLLRKKPAQGEVFKKEEGKWIVFIQSLEHEKWMIQFPDDPVVDFSSERMQWMALGEEGSSFSLKAEASDLSTEDKMRRIPPLDPEAFLFKLQKTANQMDRSYRIGEKWVAERFLATSYGFYIFRTEGVFPMENHHQKFVHSFELLQKI